MMDGLIDSLVIIGLGLIAGVLLVQARKRFAPSEDDLVTAINDLLPQTQCAQCNYPGCRPYAEAIAKGEAINRCPPGGGATINALAGLLGRESLDLDPDCGSTPEPHVAYIRENECIGCTLCIPACPVDAIIGAHQQMHTVLEKVCTGCDLCLDPCPVDCIELVPQSVTDNVTPIPVTGSCINCSDCIEVCPKDLQPQLLFWHREQPAQAENLGLFDCIECGICDRACPSALPLTASFRYTKSRSRLIATERASARESESRFERHQQRLSSTSTRIAERPGTDDRKALLGKIKGAS